MLTRALLIAVCGLALTHVSMAESARTFVGNDMSSLHLNSNTGPMRTLLTRENKFPDVGHAELGGYYDHAELDDADRDAFGVYGRYSFWENATFEAGIPVVNSDFSGDDETGIGDVDLKLDLLAFQDIFRYPFIIPHFDLTLPSGDEDDGLGTGETVFTLGISVGTKVYDQLTYVVDISYSFDGADENYNDNDVFFASGSIIWDISDRFAVLVEGRIFEENDFKKNPYQFQAGLAYRISPDIQIAGYGGQYIAETDAEDDSYDLASVRLAVQF